MRKILTAIVLLSVLQANAQDGLFSLERAPARKGVVFGFNGGVDFPFADMADRFGTSYRVGGEIFYKTKSNWLFGAKFDYLFGNKIKEDSLMINISDPNGAFISQIGQRVGVTIFERGFLTGIEAGKIFPIGRVSGDNGIMTMTTVGLMQHKIFIRDRDDIISPIKGDYKKGYDRLTNGTFIEQYVGYVYYDPKGLVNFNIGIDFVAGFTKGRRDFLYDVMRTDNNARVDILFGIRAGWYLPIFKRKSEELFF